MSRTMSQHKKSKPQSRSMHLADMLSLPGLKSIFPGREGLGAKLLGALAKGDLDEATLMVERGADMGVKTEDGDTPLHIAVKMREAELVRLMLRHEADADMRDAHGRTPLHIAAQEDCFHSARFLIAHGASLQARDDGGKTPAELGEAAGSRVVPGVLRRMMQETHTGRTKQLYAALHPHN